MDVSVDRFNARQEARRLLAKDLQGIAFAIAAVRGGTEPPSRLSRRLDDLLKYGPALAADARVSDRKIEIIFKFAKMLRISPEDLGTTLSLNGKAAIHNYESAEFWSRLAESVGEHLPLATSPGDTKPTSTPPRDADQSDDDVHLVTVKQVMLCASDGDEESAREASSRVLSGRNAISKSIAPRGKRSRQTLFDAVELIDELIRRGEVPLSRIEVLRLLRRDRRSTEA